MRVLGVDVNENLRVHYKGQLQPIRRYLASPLPTVLLAAISEHLLQAIIGRMKHRGKSRASLPGLENGNRLTSPRRRGQ